MTTLSDRWDEQLRARQLVVQRAEQALAEARIARKLVIEKAAADGVALTAIARSLGVSKQVVWNILRMEKP